MSLATSILSLAACVAAATPPIPPERCPLPGTACRPDGPWPQTKCNLLLNATACDSAIGTPVCNSDGCAMHGRCTWDAAKGSCASPPPPPPPQPCAAIHAAVDCVWSNGRDCVWKDGGTGGVCDTRPAPPPLPNCVHDHSCADNGLSTTPPMGWRSWNLFAGKNDDATMRAMMNAFVDKSRTVGGTATALSEIGYLSVGMDDGYVLCVRAHVCVCVRVCVCSTWYLCSHSLIVSTPLLLDVIVRLPQGTNFAIVLEAMARKTCSRTRFTTLAARATAAARRQMPVQQGDVRLILTDVHDVFLVHFLDLEFPVPSKEKKNVAAQPAAATTSFPLFSSQAGCRRCLLDSSTCHRTLNAIC